ncbi:MAG TPA: TetR family transcriptional regulator [Pseudomonas xinjiangensis]|uniref:TetR family transcriptional regulator n=2 Tax=root TaxID=1 RepID=A0A7V1BS98_9GAMM|nr:TetR family transcriptional regulator [Halopseudomonas xinjiangensis]HEC48978.1 TetR family transcriptional regulator [Halopseudomonas xinjiangensis]
MVRRTKQEAQETRSEIIDAAELCFHRKGISRTSLADIASAAGVTRGAIYWHFQDKADVLEALLERANMPLQPLGEAGRNQHEPDPLGRLRDLLVLLFQRVELDPAVKRINEIIFHKCEYTDDMCDLRNRIQSFRHLCDQNIESTLRNAMGKGQLPPDLDAALASRCVHSFVSGVIDQWLLVPEGLDLAVRAESLADAIVDMLRLSPALRSSA